MTFLRTFGFLLFVPMVLQAGYSNYNDVLIGEQAAGMGGAYTGLAQDPSAVAFYNPAGLSRMKGTSLSAAATLFHKYDAQIGQANELGDSISEVNRGRFISIPATGGWVMAYGPFAVGLSIIVPDYKSFSGQIQTEENIETSLSLQDESLWVGGSIALNLTPRQSLGATIYYTSRYYERLLYDQTVIAGETQILDEKKSYATNSIVYVLGYYNQLSDYFSMGISYRFPSLLINGEGQYFRSTLDTTVSTEANTVSEDVVGAETRIPDKLSLGLAYSVPAKVTYSLDVSYYAPVSYDDMALENASDRIRHKGIVNFAIGADLQISSIVRWRLGAFTNYSSHPDFQTASARRQGLVDKWGFSSNIAIFTTDKISFTFGGYYTGGEGTVVEFTGQNFQELEQSEQIFSMLIGSSYYF